MKHDIMQHMVRRAGAQRLIQKPLVFSPALQQFIHLNAPSSFAMEALETANYHTQCKQSGIDDGRRYFEYFLDDELVGVCGYHQRKCDPPSVVWGGFFITATRSSPLTRMQIKFDSILHILRHTEAQLGYIETYADQSQSNMLAILEKLDARKVGELKDFYGPGVDMQIMQLDLQAMRAKYLPLAASTQ